MINRFHVPTIPLKILKENLSFKSPNPRRAFPNSQSPKGQLPLQVETGVLQCADSIDNQTGAPTPLQIEQPKNFFQRN